jgi:protein dithiol oxidoreductase (disulfide-forming)
MSRSFVLAALLALCLAACSRESPPAPSPAAAPAATTPAPASTPAEAPAASAASGATQSKPSETEQATGAQESGDGSASERPTSGDTSLERMASLPADAQLPGGRWKPGVNYDPVVPAQPTSASPGQVEVLEVMWLGCPHCYALEPYVKSWLKTKPAYVTFVRAPVMWEEPAQRAHAHLFYALQALGGQDLVEKAFDAIHQQKQLLTANNPTDAFDVQQAWAVKNGISAADFKNAYDSFTVSSDLQRAEELTQRYHVLEVPFFVVNGKYTTEVTKAGGPSQLMQLVSDLAAYEHRR